MLCATEDLKLEPREGGVALWVGPGTEGYSSNFEDCRQVICDRLRGTLAPIQALEVSQFGRRRSVQVLLPTSRHIASNPVNFPERRF